MPISLTISRVFSLQDLFSKIHVNLPTRIQDNTHTLIDQKWSNSLEENIKSKSRIIIKDISDHKMIFTYMEITAFFEKIDKFIKIDRNNQVTMQNFVDELRSMNQNVNKNPEDNYERFIHTVNNAREKHLQLKIVKYNKKT